MELQKILCGGKVTGTKQYQLLTTSYTAQKKVIETKPLHITKSSILLFNNIYAHIVFMFSKSTSKWLAVTTAHKKGMTKASQYYCVVQGIAAIVYREVEVPVKMPLLDKSDHSILLQPKYILHQVHISILIKGV